MNENKEPTDLDRDAAQLFNVEPGVRAALDGSPGWWRLHDAMSGFVAGVWMADMPTAIDTDDRATLGVLEGQVLDAIGDRFAHPWHSEEGWTLRLEKPNEALHKLKVTVWHPARGALFVAIMRALKAGEVSL